jgi:outer membrane scaffolding protein for murein synthesis (MipA/OmpV family)
MRIFGRRTMARRLAIAVAGQMLILTAAQADDSAATHAANYLRGQGTYVPGWDVALGGGPDRFGEHLFFVGSADVEQLLDDAASSPITFASTGVTARIGVGYHF